MWCDFCKASVAVIPIPHGKRGLVGNGEEKGLVWIQGGIQGDIRVIPPMLLSCVTHYNPLVLESMLDASTFWACMILAVSVDSIADMLVKTTPLPLLCQGYQMQT